MNLLLLQGDSMRGIRLRDFEELVLLGVRLNGKEACGVTIQRVLEREAGRAVSLGAIYTALERLARKGLVESWLGEPTPVRGGRRKRHYELTPVGLEHLSAIRRIRNRMWEKSEPEPVEKEATS
jgi:DNA-binding PadR family transcriptional regulator